MKFSQDCANKAIRIFVPDIAASKKALPEALNMAAVEVFLLNGKNHTAEKGVAEAVIRVAIKEIREKGSLSFGTVEWDF
jgi:hypothetical protein